MQQIPSDAAMRRALRRARDGVALDVTEAAVLLAARGEHLDELLAAAVPGARRRAWSPRAVPGWSPTRARSSSRSPGCAATAATTARSPPCRTGCRPRSWSATRCWTSPGRARRTGCKEALFTLGDRPEDRWPAAREWLDERGYDSTLDYVRACAIAVLEETGLLPHLNPGVLSPGPS